MCSTNPSGWVTFEDDPVQASPRPKTLALEHQGPCRPNGLRLSLSGPGEPPSTPSSLSSTPLPSPLVDFFFSPGPPSNSPLCTPTREFAGFPGIPRAGTQVLDPIPESSPGCPPLTSSLRAQPAHAPTSTSDPPSGARAAAEGGPHPAESDAPQFQSFQEDYAFCSPFWKEEDGAPQWPPGARKPSRGLPGDQKSLNQCALSYVCEKLQHLQAAEHQEEAQAAPDASSTPLFCSQPRAAAGWPFLLRIPEKKTRMSSRQWGPIFLRVLPGGILQLFYARGLESPFRELQLDPHCRLSAPRVQGHLHTVQLERVAYAERRGHRVGDGGPAAEQMLKLGTPEHPDLLAFAAAVEDELARLPAAPPRPGRAHEDPEMLLEVEDRFRGVVARGAGGLAQGAVLTRVWCLCFLAGAAERCFVALNLRDAERPEGDPEGSGVRLREHHLHGCVDAAQFARSRVLRFAPPDACRVELLRFRPAAPRGDPPPLRVRPRVAVRGAALELRADVRLDPGLGLGPGPGPACHDVVLRFPVPARWAGAEWTRNVPTRARALKVRRSRGGACLGGGLEPAAEARLRVSAGAAAYESAFRALVWRLGGLPAPGSGPDQTYCLSYKLELGSDQEIPSDWHPFATVEFEVLDTYASGIEVLSLGVDSDVQPQKHIQKRACYSIQVEIEKEWIKIDGEDPDKADNCMTQ
ncbi:LOW QUALITY PROTEIN: stonin-1 [Suncus etruscus]|uniref:LOW QUALITY PROTEIN: stonin-1 n=1 Tax=Suncus etruscus TaxID=109475 RepID=UPI00210F71C8|nr:LOW QUALITY PROTEIN: stonin-1 [Suncus etruscus]